MTYCLILKKISSVAIGLCNLGEYSSIILMVTWKWTHLAARGRRGWYNLAMYWQQYHFNLHGNPAKEMAKGETSALCGPLEGINQCSWQNSLSADDTAHTARVDKSFIMNARACSLNPFTPPYEALVHPLLEYGMSACSLNLVADVNHLERTRLVTGFCYLPSDAKLQRLGLRSLQRATATGRPNNRI